MYLKYYKLYDYTYENSFGMTDFLFSLYVHKLNLFNAERSSLVNFLMVAPNVLNVLIVFGYTIHLFLTTNIYYITLFST